MEFDWSGLEKALIGRVTDFVRRLRAEHPGTGCWPPPCTSSTPSPGASSPAPVSVP
ncbi:hypothetical protein ACFQ60_43235 [Streptomyces zhihengii]